MTAFSINIEMNNLWIYLIAYIIVIITSYLVNRNKSTNDFVSWIKHAFQGNDGKASYRALSAFVLLILICYKVIQNKTPTNIDLQVLYSLEVTFLLLTSVISIQNVITIIKGHNNSSAGQEEQKQNAISNIQDVAQEQISKI